MDAVRNPFAPGAGSRPPELAGREIILQDAQTAIDRALLGKPSRSQMLLGLRGVGKTVLLNKIEELAEAAGHITSSIEAPEGKALSELLVPKINQALRKLSTSENASPRSVQRSRPSSIPAVRIARTPPSPSMSTTYPVPRPRASKSRHCSLR